MKKIFFIPFLLMYISSFSQSIVGNWEGILNVQTIQLKLIFNINKTDKGLVSTMDSPDQGAKGIPVTTIDFENNVLKLKIDNANIAYEGVLKTKDTIIGNFVQSGQSFPLILIKKTESTTEIPRYQEPSKPYLYHSENIFFDNKKDSVRLGGTLTLPRKKGKFPVVILITGSDEEIDKNETITINAGQINEDAVYNWYDQEGNLIYTGTDLTVSPDVTIKYKLEIISNIDGFKDYDEVEITVNPYKLESLIPNPASQSFTVNYIAGGASSAYLMVVNLNTGGSDNYILDVQQSNTTIDISTYVTGLYNIILVCDGEVQNSKTLIKQ